MKTKDLVELIKNGANPIVKIHDKGAALEGPDDGMLGRIIGVGVEDVWERGTSIIPFNVDFKEFESHNKSVAICNWYDKSGNPTLIWMETDYYERDAKNHEIYEMYVENQEYADLSYFEIIEDNKWLNKYLESKSELNYTRWLENQLDNLSS
jgi:hypothetical protein